MEPKKNPNIAVGRNSSLYFAIGLNVMLLTTWLFLEHKTYERSEINIDVISMSDDFEEDIPITKILNIPPPPPPPTPVIQEVIRVVEDEVEIEETIIESTEADMEQVIADRTIFNVEEVEVEEVEEEVEVPFAVVEQVPTFPGCSGNNAQLMACFKEKMTEHIRKHFNYPEAALENNWQGKVYVMFSIDNKGNLQSVKTRGPYKILEEEAQRIISLIPKMIPAEQRGVPVKISYSVPISFKLLDQ
ncbi:MAG: energy transducer TonB [Winogradskyella sp.]|uniref:energy transducer TonB n=1 Tax=Winogradskyella sp. TaxID=1883156 RepID=UPI0017E16281|nr:energy transducer TonB [Winogradskyella sp.]